ncbi:MAG: iron ABC transporter permease [Desulfobacteraceae bacterium]
MDDRGMRKKLMVPALQIIVLVLAATAALSIGSTRIPFDRIPSILLAGQESADYHILVGLRLPRLILAAAVGGSLGLAGTLLQGMFRNPLVEPYTLGISGGASLGVCLAIVFHLTDTIGIMAYPISGFAGAGAVIVLVYFLGIQSGGIKPESMLLTGVMISFVSSSLVMFLMAVSKSDDLHNIIFWIMGSLDEPNTGLIKIVCTGSITGLVISLFYCHDLNAMVLGHEEASFIGVNTVRTRKVLFVTASLLTGLSVSVAGIIMFVGLIIPHFMRMLFGGDHRTLIINSFFGGASFLIFCDLFARTVISPLELPVGVITGIIGGVVFIWVLARKQVVL